MSDSLFPSGPWTGFYNYRPGDRHKMELHLTFAAGRLSGDGNDDIGPFLIKGRYDASTLECYWAKKYLGAHDVFYRGFREGKGIWGTWEITVLAHGGFHIWPRHAAEGEAEHESTEQSKPVDAIAAAQVHPDPAPGAQKLAKVKVCPSRSAANVVERVRPGPPSTPKRGLNSHVFPH